jgi:hypothetical protein
MYIMGMGLLSEFIAALITAVMPAPSANDNCRTPKSQIEKSQPIATGVFIILALLIVVVGFIFLAFL